MGKTLKLYTYVDGVSDTPFPQGAEEPIEIGSFRYDAKRMGGAPTITASVNYPSCLDDEWTDSVYAEFNGEKYYLKQTPTSSYDNADTMYKHDLELVSERRILDDVYFFDVVTGDPSESDKPVSNSTKVVFFGDVREFASRLQGSLEYSGIDYAVEVDDDIDTEEKLMSFEDQFFSSVLQEIYNTYEVPYYFDGKTIHIGDYKKPSEEEELPVFSYGVDDALLSITKNNANYKIVNRATATGSSDNIPFYYPNNSPKGNIEAVASNDFDVKIVDYDKYANSIELNGILRKSNINYENLVVTHKGDTVSSGQRHESEPMLGSYSCVFAYTFDAQDAGEMSLTFNPNAVGFRNFNAEVDTTATIESRWRCMLLRAGANPENPHGSEILFVEESLHRGEREVKINVEEAGQGYIIAVDVQYVPKREYENTRGYIVYSPLYSLGSETGWVDESGKSIDPASVGLQVDDRAEVGDTITQNLVEYINTSQNLLPFKYRDTKGKKRFYDAINGIYDGITFNNPFVEGKPKEHIFSVEDIKPSIEGMEYNDQRIDMFEDIRFDEDDNDETYEDEEGNVYFKHPYFFAKLKPLGFNLFDHAIEQQPMTVSFTKGDCGACNFEIAVDEDTQKNIVQVDANGDLIYVGGRVLCGAEGSGQYDVQPQDIQQDTTDHSVWIALRKEEDTYGILMPQYGKHEPSVEDTFVILGINLPYEYIEAAEKKLEAEIIKYLKDNNDEKFTFSIGFSRIFFEENDILEQLNENSKIAIMYNGQRYELYVSSFSYNMSEGDALPEIRVELDETLKVSQNALQNAISEVKSQLGRAINNIDVVGASTPYFIRKDRDDEARGVVDFKKGIKFGEGGKVEVMDNNSAKLTIEYLEVTKKASFTSLEIQEKTHVGGQILVTPAAINCGEVEEAEDFYRCYFQTKGIDGDEIFNQFVVGDQAICQTYNAWGSKYYWRLVTGIGEDYIDLSKVAGEYDEDSDIPMAGDKIIQLGNQSDTTRQNAIVIAAYGDGSPYIIQYKGINSFEISDDKIVTKLSSTENIFTGIVHIQEGSDGFGELGDFADIIQESIQGIEVGGQNMLRNSGFTGDYLSAQLADEVVLEATDKMFNPPLVHWTNSVNVVVIEEPQSTSGYAVRWSNSGVLIQSLYQKTLASENYIFSFRAKGVATMTARIGGVVGTIEIDSENEFKRYVYPFVAAETVNTFIVTLSDEVIMCEPQLERGTIATAWSNSYLDNLSDRAYYQAGVYVQQALHEGSTTIGGGLVLTNHIKVGNYANKEMIQETGGMQGSWTSDDDPFLWGGGTNQQAINAVLQNGEGEDEANFVVTHGGKAILNDAKVRGTIYANDGEFKGKINIDAPNVDGRVQIDDSGLAYFGKYNDEEYMRVALGGTCQGASLATYAPNAQATFCTNTTMLAVGDEDTDALHAKGNVWLYDGVVYVDKLSFLSTLSGDHGKIEGTVDFEGEVAFNGKVKGLQETIVISDSNMHRIDSENGASILVNMTSGTAKIALGSTNDGNEVIIESKGASIQLSASKSIYDHYNQAYLSSSINNRGVIRLKYYESAGEWTMTWIAKY